MSTVEDYEWDELPMKRLETTFEEYMDGLYDSLYNEPEQDAETETGFSFCGCETCVTRETFAFLMPRFIDLYLTGAVRLQPANKDGDSDVVQLVQDGRDS